MSRGWFLFSKTQSPRPSSLSMSLKRARPPLPRPVSFLSDSRVFSEGAADPRVHCAVCLWSVHQSGLFAERSTPGAKRNEVILGLAVTGAPHQPPRVPQGADVCLRSLSAVTTLPLHSSVTSPCPQGLDFRKNLGDSFIQCVGPFSLVRRRSSCLGPWHGPLESSGHSRQCVGQERSFPPCVPKLGEEEWKWGPSSAQAHLGAQVALGAELRGWGLLVRSSRAGLSTQGAHTALSHPHSLLSL